MRELLLACPPGFCLSINNVFNPSHEPYTEAASPAGPAPIITTSYIASAAFWRRPTREARAGREGSVRNAPSFNTTRGKSDFEIPELEMYCSASAFTSASSHKNGTRFPDKNSLSLCDLGDH